MKSFGARIDSRADANAMRLPKRDRCVAADARHRSEQQVGVRGVEFALEVAAAMHEQRRCWRQRGEQRGQSRWAHGADDEFAIGDAPLLVRRRRIVDAAQRVSLQQRFHKARHS